MDISKATQQFPELLNIYLLYNKYRSNSNIIGLIQRPKIIVSEILEILVWILSLPNISRDWQEHFLGLIWWDLNVGYF